MKRDHKFKGGNCYLVRFLDHTHGTKTIIEVEIIAWCLEIHSEHVVFTSWRVDDEDEDMVSNNHEPVSIIKSTIIGKRSIQVPVIRRRRK